MDAELAFDDRLRTDLGLESVRNTVIALNLAGPFGRWFGFAAWASQIPWRTPLQATHNVKERLVQQHSLQDVLEINWHFPCEACTAV